MFKYRTQVITIVINNAAPVSIISQDSKSRTFFVFIWDEANKLGYSQLVHGLILLDRSINLFQSKAGWLKCSFSCCLAFPQGHRSRSPLCWAVVSLGEGEHIFFCCAGLAGRGLYTWGGEAGGLSSSTVCHHRGARGGKA